MKRIEELVNLIEPYKIIADIGCDHGYLIKMAFDKDIINKAYAIDNKKGPLNNAKNVLSGYKNITFLLSDGLDDLQDDTEVIVLAGMGGNLITNILEKGLNKLDTIKRIIIEANRNSEQVREFAIHNNLKIVFEKIIEEDSIYYEIIVLQKGLQELSSKEIKYGPILLKEKSELFIEKLKKQLTIYKEKNSVYLEEEINEIKGILEDEN